MSDLRDQVRDRYAAAATAVADGTPACCAESAADASCCAPEGVAVDEGFGAELYSSDERAGLPAEAVLASLGCGNPLASPTCGKARWCSTSAPAAGSTCCSPPAGAEVEHH